MDVNALDDQAGFGSEAIRQNRANKGARVFPIRDHNPSGRIPYVTYAILGLNIVIFLSYVAVINEPRRFNPILIDYALFPVAVSNGEGYLGIFTSMFMHGGWMHLIGNMLFLWIFGDNMEDAFGHLGFAVFYLVCGVLAGLAHVMVDPSSQVPLVGASGAIAGVLGGYLLLFPKARVDILFIFIVFFRVFSLPAWIVLAVWLAIQVFSGATTDISGGGVAYWAHAGGFIAGIVLSLPYWWRQGAAAFWDRTHGHPPHPPQKVPTHISRIPIVQKRK